jgi:histone acetyltransferase 1
MSCSKHESNDKKISSRLRKDINNSQEPLTCEVNSNEVIYFKIIHNESEFHDFINNNNFENTFRPIFTNQIFKNEKINGYKGIKILISLTPKRLFPHIKIIYEKQLQFHDNIEKIFKDFFLETFNTDETKFISLLNEENKILNPKGKLIYKEKPNRDLYIIDILKDDFKLENWNYQTLNKFFIDGASFIQIQESNYWNYFYTIERTSISNNEISYNTVGYCSFKNFHMEINKYCTMLSQFLILPPYQRHGYGSFMLYNSYKYLSFSNKECIEITTEDPCIDFILMRDYTIIKMLIDNKKLDSYLKLLENENEICSIDIYNKFTMSKEQVTEVSKELKLQKNLIQRAFDIVKYTLCSNKIKEEFVKYKKNELKQSIKSEYDLDLMFVNKKRGPFIYFHDEENFDYRKVIEEDKMNLNMEMTLEQKVEMLFIEYDNDVHKIMAKCGKLILNYKQSLTK